METTDTKRTFRLILYDALASEAMGALTAGVFLTGFLVELGASNLAIGLLAAVPFTVQFLQLPAVVLVERLRDLGRGHRPLVSYRRRDGAIPGRDNRHHHARRVRGVVSGDGRCRRLRLEFLDARSRPGE